MKFLFSYHFANVGYNALLDLFVRSDAHRYDEEKPKDEPVTNKLNPNSKKIDAIDDEMFGENNELLVYILH